MDLIGFAADAADAWRYLKAAGIAAADGRLSRTEDPAGTGESGEGIMRR
jgi:hypothetical protein